MASDRGYKDVLRDLGLRLKAARAAAHLTQEQTAERAELDEKRIQRIESGKVNVTVRTLVRITSAIGVSIWQLPEPPADRQPRRRRRS